MLTFRFLYVVLMYIAVSYQYQFTFKHVVDLPLDLSREFLSDREVHPTKFITGGSYHSCNKCVSTLSFLTCDSRTHLSVSYEERSLGIYEHFEDQHEEPELSGTPRERIGKYLNWHLRRQLSIGWS